MEIGKFEITVKDLTTGKSRPFVMILNEDEEGDFIWWGYDSTEDRRLGEWLKIIKENLQKQL